MKPSRRKFTVRQQWLRAMAVDVSCAIVAIVIALVIYNFASGQQNEPSRDTSYVIDFTAAWCAPCRDMAGKVRLAELLGADIRVVDIDRDRKLAQSYSVRSIPCFVAVRRGREVGRIVGTCKVNDLMTLHRMAEAQQ